MAVTDAPSSGDLMSLPYELLEAIFQYLMPEDLGKLAVCCRRWRCALNLEFWWRPFCRRNGWEYYYSRLADISKKTRYEQRETGNEKVAFSMDAIIREDNPTGLPGTCIWKEIYMIARHLEANWKHNRFHVTVLKVFEDAQLSRRPYVRCSDGDGDLLAMSFSDGTIKVWDVRRGICLRVFRAQVLSRHENTVKIKRGVVVAGCKEGPVRAFSVSNGKELPPMEGHMTDIQCLFFDGDLVVSQAVSDHEIRVWSVCDGACRHILARPKAEFTAELKDMDCRDEIVAAVYRDNHLRVWHARSGLCVHASSDTDYLQSVKVGVGTVASLHHGPDRTTVVIRSVETEDRLSIPVYDFKVAAGSLDIHNYFANGGLFLRAIPHRIYEGVYLKSHNNRDVQFLTKFGNMKTVYCCHGNRCILEDRYDYKNNDYHIFEASADRFQLLRSATHGGEQSKRLTVWMDDTKVIFKSLGKDPSLYVHHYW